MDKKEKNSRNIYAYLDFEKWQINYVMLYIKVPLIDLFKALPWNSS